MEGKNTSLILSAKILIFPCSLVFAAVQEKLNKETISLTDLLELYACFAYGSAFFKVTTRSSKMMDLVGNLVC